MANSSEEHQSENNLKSESEREREKEGNWVNVFNAFYRRMRKSFLFFILG